MKESLTKLGFAKTAKVSSLHRLPAKHSLMRQVPLNTSMQKVMPPVMPSPPSKTSWLNTNKMPPYASGLADAYKVYRDKVIHLPVKTKKHKGVLSLGNVYGMHPKDPNMTKGLKYTWKVK